MANFYGVGRGIGFEGGSSSSTNLERDEPAVRSKPPVKQTNATNDSGVPILAGLSQNFGSSLNLGDRQCQPPIEASVGASARKVYRIIVSQKSRENLGVVQESYISVNNAELYCKTIGKGKPIVVVHGGPGLCHDYLLPHFEKLAENNHLIFYDQRGCGQSSGEITPGMINIETFVEDLEAIRKAFNIEKFSILGHSWGGPLAMQYAKTYSQHVDHLILSNPLPATSEDYSLYAQEWRRRMAPHEKELEAIRQTKEFAEGNSEIVAQMYQIIFRTFCYNPEKVKLLNFLMTPSAAINNFKVYDIFLTHFFNTPYDLTDSMGSLQVPTLIVQGDAEPIPYAAANRIQASIKGSKLAVMVNCGHFPYAENRDSYFTTLDQFLNDKL